MLSPPADNDDNGLATARDDTRRAVSGGDFLESERSPNREKAARGVHWSPNRPPLTFLFSVLMSVSD